jgi:6-phosphogluconolactonase (cycloisomerase 2 family)
VGSRQGAIFGYAIDRKSGELKNVKGSPFATGSDSNPASLSIDGTFVYVTDNGSGNLTEFGIDKKSGALKMNGTIGAGNDPDGVAVDPTGTFLYMSHGFGRSVSAYTINANDGLLTPVGSYGSGFRLSGLAIDPTDKFLYVVGNAFNSCQHGLVRAFAMSAGSGVLTHRWKGSSGGECASKVVVR